MRLTVNGKRPVSRRHSFHDAWVEKGRCASVSVAGDWCELKAGHAPVHPVVLDGSATHQCGGLQWEGSR